MVLMMTHPTVERAIPVLFEDGDCVVFDKPPGLLVIPTPRGESHTLVALADRQFPKEHLHPAHRLDRDTSGVILFAKGKNNQHKLMALFKERRVKKDYVAFVHGRIHPAKGDIRVPIKDRYKPSAPAVDALTHYCVVDHHKDFTVVDVQPVTGRTNQIRIHFSKVGHPLVGEDVYALRKDFVLRFRRTALHAARLEWPSLSTGRMQAVASSLPRDMAEFLEKNP